MGMCTNPKGKFRPLTNATVPVLPQSSFPAYTLLTALFIFVLIQTVDCIQDAVHITAILGESVVFNCHVEFPEGHPVPYVLQWEKKVGETGQDIPIYIWYESYPTHSGEGYEGRVSRVSPDSPYGAASLNLTNIRESDQGWYECKVVFLNRPPNQPKNGTWFHLDVHAPPRFVVTPEDIIYVNLGDAIILNCQAEGTPTPEILWFKDANPVEPSSTIGIFNDGTELRISNIRHEDIGDYTCIARNGEGQISHTARVIIAGGAVIMVPPTNQTKLEGEKVQFNCEAKAQPGNVTVKWFREGAPVKELASLETRVTIKRDGSLVINPVSSEDSGQYLCEVSNGIGEPQSASAYLNVEYPAKVTFTPTIQYLPFRLAGVVQCYIKANPPLQYVTWTKDKRLLEPYQTKDIVIMNNGSLLFTRVNENHQGRYTCTPYNAQGTQGSSGQMEVLVRKPPTFIIEPETMYQRKVGESVDMPCDAVEAEGTQKPTIQWQRRDGTPLPKNRVKLVGGNLTLESIRRLDFGFYQCVATNEVATIITGTQLVVEGTQPHAPYNLTGIATEFSVTLSWLPGYSGGPDYKQEYTMWYREAGTTEWSTIPVTPSGATTVTINRLAPGTNYEFHVIGKNALGDGMMSKIITVRTVEVGQQKPIKITPTPFMTPNDDAGPKPGVPRNLTVNEISNGFLITWMPPVERAELIQHYVIKYRTDGPWKTLNKAQIRPEDTHYLVKNLVGGRTYYFRILAYSGKSYETSEEVKFSVPARVKHKALTAGVVGGILFFIVAITLSVCAVKICNKRKRRKQEKAYNMVACRITDSRNGGNATDSQVPLKKLRKGRIPGLRTLAFIANWIWPRDRCRSGSLSSLTWHPDYLHPGSPSKSLARISRAADGRFVLVDSVLSLRADSASNISSSDDGGFLPKRGANNRASWRRPLVGYPSELSLRSDASGQSASGLPAFIIGQRYQQQSNLKPLQTIYSPHTPQVMSSSPATSSGLLLTPWSPMYFSDLSSVRYTSSGERSFPTPPGFMQLKSVHERYSQELPPLKAIHEEHQGFIPVHPVRDSPRVIPQHRLARSSRLLPPRHARIARSAPELDHLDRSPESRSSSSGFGSKNTSQQNQSSHSGSTLIGWGLPPYRPPPPVPSMLPPPPPSLVGHWLDIASSSPSASDHIHKAVDVGSVDGHYEFDPSTPTPTPSTPTGSRDIDLDTTGPGPPQRKSYGIIRSRYDNIDARVQAMKQEFNEFRKRQASRRRSQELESAC
ncbi:protein turtle isoform X3 [Diorhabda carinulata]|uniref:protein turtle isoform X3 n=1 Tax=Diorhabda carinulata TaxID=1163345 RepID=UPI0025A1D7E4|nr:protein turtle isoform X3 [Diorhabda carinulata]XP_057659539.1 protein turtle isoform X3 [Diorhabda carinulata]XP_057659540.1 protein turtle isoform X3 [Diorhabda carinulata]